MNEIRKLINGKTSVGRAVEQGVTSGAEQRRAPHRLSPIARAAHAFFDARHHWLGHMAWHRSLPMCPPGLRVSIGRHSHIGDVPSHAWSPRVVPTLAASLPVFLASVRLTHLSVACLPASRDHPLLRARLYKDASSLASFFIRKPN